MFWRLFFEYVCNIGYGNAAANNHNTHEYFLILIALRGFLERIFRFPKGKSEKSI